MKLKKDKVNNEDTGSAIVGSAQVSRKKIMKSTVLITVFVGLLIIGTVTAVLYVDNNEDTANVQEEDTAVSLDDSKPSTSNIDTLTEEQLRAAAAVNVDPKIDIEATRTKAAALAQLNDYQGAIVVYDQITVSGAGNYEDTANYAYTAVSVGDIQKAIDLFKKATEELQASNVSQSIKDEKTAVYANKVFLLEKERAQ